MTAGQIPGTTVMVDPEFGTQVFNDTDVPSSAVYEALSQQQQGLVAAMGQWSGAARGVTRNGSLFQRDKFVTPHSIFAQMRLASDAAEHDDVVGGVIESTESLAFSKVSMHANDMDEQDVYNQIAADLDLDSRLREMWRELFTVSQFYCGVWWKTKEYKVTGKGRKKKFNLRVPEAITMLDPTKVVPIGMSLFNRERLAWIATREEADHYEDRTRAPDPIMERFLLGRYEPSEAERRWLVEEEVDPNHLFEINPANVFRHTATRPQYQRFASLRLKSIFPLLDLKEQLRAMDRAHLIGGTNFIVLITQGSDQNPAKPEEIAHLQASVRVVAQTPVLIGDHRLDVKIVTPKLDTTLDDGRYNTIDLRITSRLYQTFIRGAAGDRADTSEGLVKVVAAGMESRRKMLRRTLEKHIFSPLFEQNDDLLTPPKLEYHPRSIALDFNDALATFMLSLREAREISRHTLLSQFEFSQEFEAEMLEREEEEYDDVFKTINPNNQGQPGSGVGPQPAKPAVAPEDPKQAGKRKGGAAPGTGQGKAPRTGVPKNKPKADQEEPDGQDEEA